MKTQLVYKLAKTGSVRKGKQNNRHKTTNFWLCHGGQSQETNSTVWMKSVIYGSELVLEREDVLKHSKHFAPMIVTSKPQADVPSDC